MSSKYRTDLPVAGVPLGFRRIAAGLSAAKALDQGVGRQPTNVTGVVINFTDSLGYPVAPNQLGTLTYTAAGTLLAWQAPGDTAVGAGVNVGGGGTFNLPSGNGKNLNVTVTAVSLPGGNTSDANIIVGLPKGAAIASLVAEAQAVRWRDDGIAPTATIGMPLATGVVLGYGGEDPARCQVIEQSASATLTIAFYD